MPTNTFFDKESMFDMSNTLAIPGYVCFLKLDIFHSDTFKKYNKERYNSKLK